MCRSESNCSEANKAVGNFWLFGGLSVRWDHLCCGGGGWGAYYTWWSSYCIECQGGDYACEMGDP